MSKLALITHVHFNILEFWNEQKKFAQIKQNCSKGLQKKSGSYFCHIGKYMPYFKLFANIKFHFNKYVLFLKLNKSIILYQQEEEIN